MAIHLNETILNHFEQCCFPNRATVIFDWDNTLKVINVKKKCIQSRVEADFLQKLVRDKHCTLYIISAIQPSRMNMSTILFEVDKLGLRKYFCPYCQNELKNFKNATPDQNDSRGHSSKELEMNSRKSSVLLIKKAPSNCSDTKEDDLNDSIPWECSHKLDIELVDAKYRYARWGNIVISGYDKAEVFLEISIQDKVISQFPSPRIELSPVINLSAARCGISPEKEAFQFECDCTGEESDCTDEADDSTLGKPERHVLFFDDEKVNIDNFKAIVKNSECYLVV